jgi:phosphoribosylaminoimidazole carboxylase (NCAIR synthetase)
MFRIAWKSLLTGYKGRGQAIFNNKKECQDEVDIQNKKYINELMHWVEEE